MNSLMTALPALPAAATATAAVSPRPAREAELSAATTAEARQAALDSLQLLIEELRLLRDDHELLTQYRTNTLCTITTNDGATTQPE
jgi:hypothetical protein